MAFTPAERAKRYRERLKQNPEQYEAHKRKEVARIKKCQKKIAELSDAQKSEKRKVWREQKRKQKEKKSNQKPRYDGPPQESTKELQPKLSHSFKIRYKKVCDQYKNALNKIRKVETVLGSLRKKIHRMKQSHTKEVSLLVEENDKLKARQEIMELTLRDAYSSCKTNKEKLLLKKAAVKHRTGKVLGLKSNIRLSSNKRFENKKAKDELQEFYLRNDISRITSGKRECKTRKKQKEQKRYLVDTLKNLYEIYRQEGGKYGFTSFFINKPFYVLSPNAATRNTCLCIKHSNMELMFNALKRNAVLTSFRDVKEVVRANSCDIQNYECMYNFCKKCETPCIPTEGADMGKEINWHKWARVDHKYEKSGEEKVTKKTDKVLAHGKVEDLVKEFKKQLPIYKTHVFNSKEQQTQYQKCVQNLQENECLILCDFSENYGCKFSEEVQSMHFGASKQDITLHCGMIYTRDRSQSFVTVSNNGSHEPPAIWAHLMPVVKLAKTINPNIQVIHFYSDGPSSQYRQKKNFYLLSIFTSKLELSHSTWSFTEAGHGKSVADGIGGAAKRQLDKRVGYGYDVTNAQDAFEILKRHIVSVCYLIGDSEIEDMAALIPANIRPVPGTMKLHQVIATEANQIKHRVLSCFCGEKRGLCSCHNPKMHALMPGLTSHDAPPVAPLPPDVFVANISKNDITSCIKNSTTTPLTGVPEDVNEEIFKIDMPPLLSTPETSDFFEILSPESQISSSWPINSEIQMELPALSNELTGTPGDVSESEMINIDMLLILSRPVTPDISDMIIPESHMNLVSSRPIKSDIQMALPASSNVPSETLEDVSASELIKINMPSFLSSTKDVVEKNVSESHKTPDSSRLVKPEKEILPASSNFLSSASPVIKVKTLKPINNFSENITSSVQQRINPVNIILKKKKSCPATLEVSEYKPPMKRIRTTVLNSPENEENLFPPTQPASQSGGSSIKAIILEKSQIIKAGSSKSFLCFVCKTWQPTYSRSKCLICKKMACSSCNEGQNISDYICSVCLGA